MYIKALYHLEFNQKVIRMDIIFLLIVLTHCTANPPHPLKYWQRHLLIILSLANRLLTRRLIIITKSNLSPFLQVSFLFSSICVIYL